ncbi:MAG: hypothetical protein M3256_17850 [Actinomycetota bacterium]|nr:hypothetical protein [Actinomycetota bacterium]
MSEHVTTTGIAAAGFRSAAVFYFAARQLAEELAKGTPMGEARAIVRARCVVTDAQLDYIAEHSR